MGGVGGGGSVIQGFKRRETKTSAVVGKRPEGRRRSRHTVSVSVRPSLNTETRRGGLSTHISFSPSCRLISLFEVGGRQVSAEVPQLFSAAGS